MLFANILFSRLDWLVPAIVLLSISLLVLFWSYRSSPFSGGYRIAASLLKFFGFGALAICLLEPLWSESRARPGANLFALVADNSQGMQIKDRGATQSRAEQLGALIKNDQSSWQTKLEETFDVRRYLFDTRLHQTKDYADLDFGGTASAIGTSLRSLADRFQGRPLAGVLLFTDGNATDLQNGVSSLADLPPIYPVIVGEDQPSKDIALQTITVNQTAFEDSPVTIVANVQAVGYPGSDIIAQLIDQTGKKVAEQAENSAKDQSTIQFRFLLRPERMGISYYRMRVAAKDELAQFSDPKISTEATLANNTQQVIVDRGKGPHRILYLGGKPNWEHKFLNRALEFDEQLQMVSLIRVAKREPKFEFRGRSGEASNPLFRGFDKTSEDTERYDQPVLVRLNTRDQVELRAGFPKTPEELYPYEAVILDDIEAEFFTHEQMLLLQKFVSERGGGLLMLGGQESLYEGRYARTPVADLLPVYVDRQVSDEPVSDLKLDLTREGWLQPWIRLRNNQAEEESRLGDMPPFHVLNRVRDVKPGASVLATVSDPNGNRFPALVAQRFGGGRTAVLTLGDFWRWGFLNEMLHKDMDKAWRQTIRWLISDVPARLEIQADRSQEAQQGVVLRVKARDKNFQPLDNASVTVEIRNVTTSGAAPGSSQSSTNESGIKINAEPSPNEAGVYLASFIPREAGVYLAEGIIVDSSGVEAGRVETGWTTNPGAEEFFSLAPNRALMKQLAQQTGGEVITIDRIENLVEKLPRRSAPITEPWTSPLWHTPAFFLFALACLVSEWGLRRLKGLA